MSKMYYLADSQLLQKVLQEGIHVNTKDLIPRIYLTDNLKWAIKMAVFFNSINQDTEKKMVIVELELTGIRLFPDDMPSDFLPEYWQQAEKEQYPKHCFFTTENIPASSVKKVYDLNGQEINELLP